jgi:Tfp pilus assembly protein FimT
MKKSRFTLPELVGAMIGMAVLALVIFLVYAGIHYILKFW